MKRAIVLFPKFQNIDAIQSIRERFDPLAKYIAPHITIVFPFESALSTAELDALGSFHESFEAVIDRVYVENTDPSEQSLIERVFDLE